MTYTTTETAIKDIIVHGLKRVSNLFVLDSLVQAQAYSFYFIELLFLSKRSKDETHRTQIKAKLNSCHERIYHLSNNEPLLSFAGSGVKETSYIPCYACGGRAKLWDHSKEKGFLGKLFDDYILPISTDIFFDKIFGEQLGKIDSGLHKAKEDSIGRTLPIHPVNLPSMTSMKFCDECEKLEENEKKNLRAIRLFRLGYLLESADTLLSINEAVEFKWKDYKFKGKELKVECINTVQEVIMFFLKKMPDPFNIDRDDTASLTESRYLLDCLNNLEDNFKIPNMKRNIEAYMNEWRVSGIGNENGTGEKKSRYE